MPLPRILGGTDPKELSLDEPTGLINLRSAKALSVTYYVDNSRLPDLDVLVTNLASLVSDYNTKPHFAMKAFLRTEFDADEDSVLIWIAIGVISAYCVVFLGSCSPLHCRALLAIFGMTCLSLSYLGALAVARFLYEESVTMNQFSIPIVLSIVVGAEDIFLICVTIDRIGLHLETSQRIQEMLRQAGPTLTISTLI